MLLAAAYHLPRGESKTFPRQFDQFRDDTDDSSLWTHQIPFQLLLSLSLSLYSTPLSHPGSCMLSALTRRATPLIYQLASPLTRTHHPRAALAPARFASQHRYPSINPYVPHIRRFTMSAPAEANLHKDEVTGEMVSKSCVAAFPLHHILCRDPPSSPAHSIESCGLGWSRAHLLSGYPA